MNKDNKEFFEPEEVKDEVSVSKGTRIWNWCMNNKKAIAFGVIGTVLGALGMKVSKDNEMKHVKAQAEDYTETAIAIGKLTGALEAYQDFTKDSSKSDENN